MASLPIDLYVFFFSHFFSVFLSREGCLIFRYIEDESRERLMDFFRLGAVLVERLMDFLWMNLGLVGVPAIYQ